MASDGQDRAHALGWGVLFFVRPNRPKTIARYHTIPQKVTTVSIYAKGPEPSSLESSDPRVQRPVRRVRRGVTGIAHQPVLFHGVRHGVVPEHRGNHDRTTRALKLLISIRFPLENKAGRSPGGSGGSSNPMREAGATSTGSRNTPGSGVVPAPPGIDMVALPEVPRNAEGAPCVGRVAVVE